MLSGFLGFMGFMWAACCWRTSLDWDASLLLLLLLCGWCELLSP
jgi:hypothetical protein